MLIDWFTVAAQIVNFLILVWLLKRFLYRPILDAIDARERRIAKELADADAKKSAAQQEREEFQHKNDEFDQQRTVLLSAATEEAHSERQRLLDEARKAADDLLAQRQTALRNDARSLNQALSLRTQQEVFAIARKALSDLADSNLEARMVEIFIRRLRALDSQAQAAFGAALKNTDEPALITSAFDLSDAQRASIQSALTEIFAADIRVRFASAPEKISGIELSAQGQKIAWSIADYLAGLENGVNEIVKAKARENSK
jgi:F-type H+-transporting ATPase subunit b